MVVVFLHKILMKIFAIKKIRNTGTRNGMRGMRRIVTTILGNLLRDSVECYYFNGQEDSGKWSRRCQGMFEEVPRNGKK